jgi:hypothetical protein
VALAGSPGPHTDPASRVAPEVGALLGALTSAPAQAQAAMDAHWHAEAARWAELAAWFLDRVPPPWRTELAALLVATAPVRQVVRRYELDCRVQLRVDRRLGFALRAQPIDVGFEIAFGSSAAAAARLVAEVEVVPVPAAPSVTAELAAWTDVPFPSQDEGAR